VQINSPVDFSLRALLVVAQVVSSSWVGSHTEALRWFLLSYKQSVES